MDALQARDRSSSTREFPRTIAELSPFTFGARNRFRMIVAAHALRPIGVRMHQAGGCAGSWERFRVSGRRCGL